MRRHLAVKSGGLALSAAATFVLLVGPGAARADVVPPRRPLPEPEAVQIEQRLSELGFDAAASGAGVSDLTATELEYLAGTQERVQVVGGIQWHELAAGLLIGGALIVATVLILDHSILRNPEED